MKVLFCIISILISFEVHSNNSVILEGSSIRALFDEDFYWMTPEGADKYVIAAKKAGFNVLVPCVWHGNGATWKSNIAPYGAKWSKELINNTDPLKYLIKKAHQEGLQVHAWFTVMLRTDDIFNNKFDRSMPKMFNVHDRSFGDYIAVLINDVVKGYDIDGVNLDYIRSKEVCSSSFCKDNYEHQTGHELNIDLLSRRISKEADSRLVKWQVDAVTNIVRKISNAVRVSNPAIIVSVDTLVNDKKWTGLGANSSAWLNENIIDYIFHMDYRDNLFIKNIEGAKATLNNPERMLILVANYDRNDTDPPKTRSTAGVRTVILEAMSKWPQANGIGLYEYRFLNDEQINMIKKIFVK